MEKKLKFQKIERIEYIFTETEIRDALMKTWNIPLYDPKRKKLDFEIEREFNDPNHKAHLTLVFEEPDKDIDPQSGIPYLKEKTE